MEKYLFLDFNGTVLNDVDLCLNLLNEMLVEKKKNALNIEEYKNVFTFPIKNYYIKAGFDFNGYTYEELERSCHPQIIHSLELADFLIDGPYIEEERDITLAMRGSRNQRIIDLKKKNWYNIYIKEKKENW